MTEIAARARIIIEPPVRAEGRLQPGVADAMAAATASADVAAPHGAISASATCVR